MFHMKQVPGEMGRRKEAMVRKFFSDRIFRSKSEISHALVLPCFAWAYFTPKAELRDPAHFPFVVDEAAMKFAVEAVLAMAEG